MALHTGSRVGPARQGLILLQKRVRILRRNYLPHVAAILIALIGAGVSPGLLKDYQDVPCAALSDVETASGSSWATNLGAEVLELDLVAGPMSPSFNASLLRTAELYTADYLPFSDSVDDYAALWMAGLRPVNSLDEFNKLVSREHATIFPGGLFVGDGNASITPTFAWVADPSAVAAGLLVENMVKKMQSHLTIAPSFQDFDVPPSIVLFDFSALVFVVYFGFLAACYPASFTLYPTLERVRNVRALHYSNGVGSLPLWLAYIGLDSVFVIAISALSIMLLGVTSHVW